MLDNILVRSQTIVYADQMARDAFDKSSVSALI